MAEIQPFKRGALTRGVTAEDKGIDKLVNDLQRHFGWSDEELQNKIVSGIEWGTMFTGTGIVAKGLVKGGEKAVAAEAAETVMTKEMVEEMTTNFVAKTGFDYSKVYNIAESRAIGKGLNKLLGDTVNQGVKKPDKLIQAVKKGFVGSTIIGADLLFNWYMNDNVPFMATTAVQKARDDVIYNNADPDEALESIKQAELMMTVSKWNSYLSIRNPIMWPFAAFYIGANKLARENISNLKKDIQDAALKRKEGIPFEENLKTLYTDALLGTTDPLERARIIEKLDRIEEEEMKKGGMRGIMQTGEEDPERKKAVMLEASAAKERKEAEAERRKNQRTGSGRGSPTRTEGSESPRPQARSKLGFGI
tara:strand:+ start:94 stop:1185 length:1092 start_codon:yes stop_codon:yes gene_type:complete